MTNNIIFLDIETVPLDKELRLFSRPTKEDMKTGNIKDQEKIDAKFSAKLDEWDRGDGAALHATQGKIVVACSALGDSNVEHIADDEERIVRGVLDRIGSFGSSTIVGHYVRFDLSFLIRRALILGIRFPEWLLVELNSYKPRFIIDTSTIWSLGDRSYHISLKELAGAFGIISKDTTCSDGSIVTSREFYKYWAIDKEACIKHCASDVEACRQIVKKMAVAYPNILKQ